MKTDKMISFEKECKDWWFDFTTSEDGLHYIDYNTGIMFGIFSLGYEAGHDAGYEQAILKERE